MRERQDSLVYEWKPLFLCWALFLERWQLNGRMRVHVLSLTKEELEGAGVKDIGVNRIKTMATKGTPFY